MTTDSRTYREVIVVEERVIYNSREYVCLSDDNYRWWTTADSYAIADHDYGDHTDEDDDYLQFCESMDAIEPALEQFLDRVASGESTEGMQTI